MKKGWKIFAIVCGSIATLGIILCCVAFALGFGWRDVQIGNGGSWDNWWRNNSEYADRSDNNSNRNNGQGTADFNNIQELEIEVTRLTVNVEKYDGTTVKVEPQDVEENLNLQYYEDNGTLKVETRTTLHGLGESDNGVVTIYIPQDLKFTEVSVDVGDGSFNSDGIIAGSLDVEVGAGQAIVTNFTANELNAQCGAGKIELSGIANGDADIEVGVGSITYETSGTEKDYNYDIQCDIGNVKVGAESYSGLGTEKKVVNGAPKEMDISCGVGEIIVTFSAL